MKRTDRCTTKICVGIIISTFGLIALLCLWFGLRANPDKHISPSADLSEIASTESLYWIETDEKHKHAYLVNYDFAAKCETRIQLEAADPRLVPSNYPNGVIIINAEDEWMDFYAANHGGVQFTKRQSNLGTLYIDALMNGTAYVYSLGPTDNAFSISLADGTEQKFDNYVVYAVSGNETLFTQDENQRFGLISKAGKWTELRLPDEENFEVEACVFQDENLYAILSCRRDGEKQELLYRMEAGSNQLQEVRLTNGEVFCLAVRDVSLGGLIHDSLTISNDGRYIAYKVATYFYPGESFRYTATFIVQSLENGKTYELCSTRSKDVESVTHFFHPAEIAVWHQQQGNDADDR